MTKIFFLKKVMSKSKFTVHFLSHEDEIGKIIVHYCGY